MKLKELFKGVDVTGSYPPETEVSRLAVHSAQAGPGALFFAVKGFKQDGALFIPDAVKRGCRVVVAQEGIRPPSRPDGGDAVRLTVPDVRGAMALISGNFYGRPSEKLLLAGITGTSGKTTTSYLLDSVLRGERGEPTIIGTIRHVIHGRTLTSLNTTPESVDVDAWLREVLDRGGFHAVMEVSSHALKLKRAAGLSFSLAVFTNLSRDHMDFHPDEQDYRDSKLILFKELLKKDGVGTINADDPVSGEFIRGCRGRVITYGVRDKKADVRALSLECDAQGILLTLASPQGEMEIRSRLRGPFNAYNILAAVSGGVGAGVGKGQIIAGVERVTGVDGRFEAVDAGQPFTVLVDYAHKPDALEKALAAARAITRGRLLCVFGCGGDRDRGKRPLMGGLSESKADYTFVTSDNPRTEDPSRIISEIVSGMKDKRRFEIIEDREKAIAAAVGGASEGDTVLIAGKGHEDYQIIGTLKHHFDDRETAMKYLKLRVKDGAGAG